MVFIPILMMTFYGQFMGYGMTLLVDLTNNFNINFGHHIKGDPMSAEEANKYYICPVWIFWLTLSIIYTKVEPVIGTFTFLMGTVLYMIAAKITELDQGENAILGGKSFYYFWGVHIFGWGTQIVGHKICE